MKIAIPLEVLPSASYDIFYMKPVEEYGAVVYY